MCCGKQVKNCNNKCELKAAQRLEKAKQFITNTDATAINNDDIKIRYIT